MKTIYKEYVLKDMWAVYLYDTEKNVMGFTLLPLELKDQFVLEGNWIIEPAVQLKIIGDRYPDGFAHGHTMRNSVSARELCFKEQICEEENGLKIITSMAKGDLEARHILEYEQGQDYFFIHTQLINHGQEKIGVEMVSSYNICAFSSLEEEERLEDYILHRMQSKWSQEGKLRAETFLDLQLEPSWMRSGINSVRFGQVGSMPVRRYFPWMIAEDVKYLYGIGIQLMHPASWQMEVYNRDDRAALSGGLADREFGHWYKYIQPKEEFTTPKAVLTVYKMESFDSEYDIVDRISQRLTDAQKRNLDALPEIEKTLPIIFNEFCTTWGAPDEKNIQKIVDTISGRGITYCVIDAGWYALKTGDWTNIGDWIPNKEQFPNGLKPAVDAIKAAGMIPGIWFEMELAGMKSAMFEREEFLLKRDGYPLQTGCRRFLDMCNPEVIEYLEEKVIGTLREHEFGYLKVDYNDNIGIGCETKDGDSLGEGLRMNMEASQNFFRKIRRELPNIVIENCSSGGHRLEPSMQALCSMASFSDAHECAEIPLIAANVTRAILPAQSQIWAVMRKTDDEKRIYYSISSTFLGRMCISGDVYDIADWQWKIIEAGIACYKECVPVILDGRNYRRGCNMMSYNHLTKSQAVVRVSNNQALLVVHSFKEEFDILAVPFPEEMWDSMWRVKCGFHRPEISTKIIQDELFIYGVEDMEGAVFLLEKV